MPNANDKMTSDTNENEMMAGWASVAENKARELAGTITEQVREHPVRTLAIAGAAGFLLATVARPQVLGPILRSGLGVVAAVAIRRIAQNALGGEAAGMIGQD